MPASSRPSSYQTLLELFDRVMRDPHTLPDVPVEQFTEGSEEWQVLTRFRDMLERLQQHPQAVSNYKQARDASEVKQRDNATEHTQQFVQSALDALQAHVAVLDDSGTIIAVNAAWRHFVDDNGFLGTSYGIGDNYVWVCDTSSGDSAQEAPLVAQALREIIAKQRTTFWLEYPCHGPGIERWFSMHMSRLQGHELAQIVVTHEDITDIKRSMFALKQSETNLRAILDSAHQSITLIDRDYKLLTFNASAQAGAKFVYGKEMYAGQSILEYVAPEDLHQFKERFQQALSGKPQVIEKQIQGINGTEWWKFFYDPVQLPDGEVTSIVFTARNTNERRRAEEALKETEARLQTVVANSPVVVFALDREGIFTLSEGRGLKTLGLKPGEVVGRSVFEVYHDVPGIIDHAQRVLAGEEYTAIDRVDALAFETRWTPIHDGDGKVVGAIGVATDVTEREQAYQLLEQRVAERTRELATLLEVSKDVTSTLELQPLLGLILDHLKTMVDYTGVAISVLEGEVLRVLDYRGPLPRAQMLQMRSSLSESGIKREVMTRRAPIIVDDVHGNTPEAHAIQQEAGGRLATTFRHIQSWLGVPLIVRDRVIGLLSLTSNQMRYYTPRHAALAMTIANQAAIAIENARLYGQAQTLAAVEERQRLARELHDSVSQALYGIALGAHTALDAVHDNPSEAVEPLNYVLSLAEAGLAEMRALIFELRPESLAAEGLIAALTKQATALSARHAIKVETQLGNEPDLPLEIKAGVYRIAQEALHNTVKHARASQIVLRLHWDRIGALLEVQDNGIGFDTQQSFLGHFGLQSMHERVERLGGTLDIESTLGRGTRIRAHIPHRTSTERTS